LSLHRQLDRALTSELREAIRNGKRELLESLPATTKSASPPDQNHLDRIRAMARRWGYSTEELSEELVFAAADPAASYGGLNHNGLMVYFNTEER
jgi:hypothetical protein